MAKYMASVVGGGSGGKLSLAGLQASDRFELLAACDMRPEACEKLKELYPHIRTFTSHEQMFAQCPTDVVCVSTWPPSHRPITMDALKLPLKGILVEKPLGDTAKAGREILEAIKTRNLPMVVPHGMLVARATQEVLRRVHNREIGDLSVVEIQCARWDIINAGIHWFNYFINLVEHEPMDWVMAICDTSTRTYRDGMQVETVAVSYAQTQSGIRLVMNTGDDVKMSRKGEGTLFRIVGSKGIIETWSMTSNYHIVSPEFPEGKLFEVPTHEKSRHHLHLDRLADQMDAARADYKIPDSSQAALELVEGAYLSSKHRCRVKLPLESFTPPPNDWQPGQPYSGQGGGRDGRKLPV